MLTLRAISDSDILFWYCRQIKLNKKRLQWEGAYVVVDVAEVDELLDFLMEVFLLGSFVGSKHFLIIFATLTY